MPRSKAYYSGLQLGRIEGLNRGVEDGIAKGYESVVMPIALIVTPSISIPSLEIMLLQPFRQLKEWRKYNFRVRMEQEVTQTDIATASLIIFIRNADIEAYHLLLLAHEMGKPTIYTIDDNFLLFPNKGILGDYYLDPNRLQVFQNFLRSSKRVYVISTFFAQFVREHYNPNVICLPGSVDFEWLEQDRGASPPKQEIVIGYEGTPKDEDFQFVVPALLNVVQKFGPQIKLEFHGYVPERLKQLPNVTYNQEYKDYRSFIKQLGQFRWDIGLAPLLDTPFKNCKSNNKFREYSACGIPGIYSNTPVYADCVRHLDTGYSVPNTEFAWTEGLIDLITNPILRERIKENARSYSKAHYSIESVAAQWIGTLVP